MPQSSKAALGQNFYMGISLYLSADRYAVLIFVMQDETVPYCRRERIACANSSGDMRREYSSDDGVTAFSQPLRTACLNVR